jgi:tRNA1Val (adenine37-N6)-methyltransferase
VETTVDAAHAGRVVLEQPKQGYRFNADSVYLAAQVAEPSPKRVVDLGAGVGVIGLCLADRRPETRVTYVERQAALAALCERNVARAGRASCDRVIQADARDWQPSERVDAVVLNPPYYREAEGRVNPEPTRAAARHQLHGSLEELVAAGAKWLSADGGLHLVYPVAGLGDVWAALEELGLRAITSRFVHPHRHAPATTVLVEATRAARRRHMVRAPLVCYTDAGDRSPEAERLWRGE